MSYWRTMYHVVLPQAFRRMLPPLGNNAIALLKDSSLVSAIGLAELAYAARTVAGAYSRYWEPYLTISLDVLGAHAGPRLRRAATGDPLWTR